MYGTVKQLCALLQKNFKPDELMTLIIWTKEDVLSVLDDSRISDETAAEIVCLIDGLDAQHEYGVSLETLRALLNTIREESRR